MVGEAMQQTEFKDLSPLPEKTLETADHMVQNALHLAGLLRADPYPELS